MKKMKSPVATAVAIAIGLIVLSGYFVPLAIMQQIRFQLLDWAIIITAFAALVGIINLLMAHIKRMRSTLPGRDPLSLVVILAFAATLVVGVIFRPSSTAFQSIILKIERPIEASFMAVLAITLAFACLRLFQRQHGTLAVVFIISTVFFLLLGSGILNFLSNVPVLGNLVELFNRLPVAGARGILIGVALGSLTAGLRILMGADRPYSG
jgi:hypothetical protein